MKTLQLTLTLAALVGCGEPAATAPKPQATSKPAEVAAAVVAKPEEPPPPADPKAEALTIFEQRCTTCHGARGLGDGPAAAALNPKPATFATAEWQKSVTDEHIEHIIVVGGAGAGKSPLMPPNPDLEDKPDVVRELRIHVRGFAH